MTSPKGFGFIKGEPNLYFRTRESSASRGDTVRFDVETGHGRPQAVNVRIVDPAVAAEVARVFGS